MSAEPARICRICLVFSRRSDFYGVDHMMETTSVILRDMLQLCVPEMDLDLTEDPGICKFCLSRIEDLYNFKCNCLETENKIRDYMAKDKCGDGTGKCRVDLENIVQTNDIIGMENNGICDNGIPHFSEVFSDNENESEFSRYVISNDMFADSDILLFSCNTCGYMTTDNFKLRRHKCFIRSKKRQSPNKPNNSTAQNMIHYQQQILSNPPTVLNSQALINHQNMPNFQVFSGQPNISVILPKAVWYNCDKCAFKSRNSDLILKHKATAHVKKETQSYDCKLCPYRAISPFILQKHFKSKHCGPVKLACKFCPYESADRSNFKKHQYIHTKDKPHKCPVCDYQCVSPYQMKKHIDKQHYDKKEFA